MRSRRPRGKDLRGGPRPTSPSAHRGTQGRTCRQSRARSALKATLGPGPASPPAARGPLQCSTDSSNFQSEAVASGTSAYVTRRRRFRRQHLASALLCVPGCSAFLAPEGPRI